MPQYGAPAPNGSSAWTTPGCSGHGSTVREEGGGPGDGALATGFGYISGDSLEFTEDTRTLV